MSSPEQVAHDLLVDAFNALTAISAKDQEHLDVLAAAETRVTQAVVLLRQNFAILT